MDHEQVGVDSLDRSNNNVQVEAVINIQSTARFTQTTVVHSEEKLISNKPETKGTEIEPEIQSEPADGLSERHSEDGKQGQGNVDASTLQNVAKLAEGILSWLRSLLEESDNENYDSDDSLDEESEESLDDEDDDDGDDGNDDDNDDGGVGREDYGDVDGDGGGDSSGHDCNGERDGGYGDGGGGVVDCGGGDDGCGAGVVVGGGDGECGGGVDNGEGDVDCDGHVGGSGDDRDGDGGGGNGNGNGDGDGNDEDDGENKSSNDNEDVEVGKDNINNSSHEIACVNELDSHIYGGEEVDYENIQCNSDSQYGEHAHGTSHESGNDRQEDSTDVVEANETDQKDDKENNENDSSKDA